MRKIQSFITILFISTCFIQACKKNSVTEQYTPIVNPVIPDFTTPVNASVHGFITDENGNAVEGAIVTGGTVTAITDKFGYFKINTTAFVKSAGFVQVSKSGYFAGFRTFLPVEGKETFIRLQLIPKTNAGIIEAAVGGTVTTTDGAKVTLPANGVVVAATNAAYTGAVNISVHWLNPADENKTQLTMPGNLTGVDSAGHLNVLVTYGMLAVELSSSSGELLQMASGKKATLAFPIPASLSGTAPASIPLWYFDEPKGVWKQEGRAIKNGSTYEGDVSHFTYWNCDIGYSPVSFTAQIVDSTLHPLSNISVFAVQNQPGYSNHGFTDTAGFIYGYLPANSDLSLEASTPCSENISLKNIHTTNSGSIDLGTIKLNSNRYSITFSGSVNNCNGLPVTDGFIIITGTELHYPINIDNGFFNATFAFCPNSAISITAIDRENLQQSDPHNAIAASGVNDLGTFSACNALTQYVTYTLDAENETYTLPYYNFQCGYQVGNTVSEIYISNLLNGYGFFLYVPGADTTGNHQMDGRTIGITNPVTGAARAFEFLPPQPVVITQYGLIGQFIKANYNGTVKDINDQSVHTLSFTFQVQRSF